MPQKSQILETLPNTSLQAIKDGGRSIASSIFPKKQQLSDRIGHALRNILKVDGESEVTSEQVGELAELIVTQREKIIQLLQDRECLKVISGSSKREKDARMKLAGEVLDEVLVRITEYQSEKK